jgi:3-oxoacyl-[acyl-carrier-protein] synthase III
MGHHLEKPIREALAICRLTSEDLSLLILSQASAGDAPVLCWLMHLAAERVCLDPSSPLGNGTAYVPFCLDRAAPSRRVARDDFGLLLAAGAGLTAWAVIRW